MTRNCYNFSRFTNTRYQLDPFTMELIWVPPTVSSQNCTDSIYTLISDQESKLATCGI